MERTYYKAINFDLDTKQLKEIYSSENYTRAYYDVKKFFKEHGFSHKQGSGYLSDKKLSSVEIFELIDDLTRELSWIKTSVKAFDVTNVGNQYELVSEIRNDDEIEIDI